MSRIGKRELSVPSGVQIQVQKGNVVEVKGPKGQLTEQIHPDLSIKLDDGILSLERPTESLRHKSMHGLSNALISNMIKGVSEGYTVELELVGVGYRVSNKGSLLEMSLGYSHPVYFVVPDEVKVETKMEKGSPPYIKLESIDKQLIGQVAAKIRGFRKIEPYKGKGVRFKGEVIRRKAGKAAAK